MLNPSQRGNEFLDKPQVEQKFVYIKSEMLRLLEVGKLNLIFIWTGNLNYQNLNIILLFVYIKLLNLMSLHSYLQSI